MAVTVAHELRLTCSKTLSVEYLFWAAKQVDGFGTANYTTVPAIRSALNSPGQPEETFWPYDPQLKWPSTVYKPPNGTPKLFVRTSDPRDMSPDAVANAIANGGAPVIVLHVTGRFFRPIDGRVPLEINDKRVPGLRHAVAVVGTGSMPDGSTWVVVQNSWGADWGVQGFGLLDSDYVASHIAATLLVN